MEQLEYIARNTMRSLDLDDDLALTVRNDTAVYRYLRTRTTDGDDAAI